MKDTVAIVGAGLTGCLLARYLARAGHRVDVYERRPDPRDVGPELGRSINLALSERGLDALRRVGLEERVLAGALPMHGRLIHSVDGTVGFQRYSHDRTRAINSVGRAALNNTLLDAAETAPGVTVRFGRRLTGLDPSTGGMTFETSEGEERAHARVVIGADGAGSAVRGLLAAHGRIEEHTEFLGHGYKELTLPPRDGDFALDPRALHIWPRGASMVIALPNPDRSFTCTVFKPLAGPSGFAALGTPAAVLDHFRRHYPDLVDLAPDLAADYLRNPVGRLGTVRCTAWQTEGRVALLGDAAHAIAPFYGQGANCGFEDVVELDRCLREFDGDWRLALPRFERRRKANAEAIAQMSLANFVEMRDKVASPAFRLAKSAERAVGRALSGRLVSQYELVSFSTVPYAQVRDRLRHRRQLLAAGALLAVTAGVSTLRRRGRPA